jgi:hypothetical protein
MPALHGIRILIVASSAVRPHEIADATREARIEQRLRVDDVLRDPVLAGIVPDVTGHVLLDGTNRQRALASLGLPWVLVQELDYADQHSVQLRTWCHLVRLPLIDIVQGAGAIRGVEITPLAPLEACDALQTSTTLAVLLGRTERHRLSHRSDSGTSRADQLRQLIDLYERHMTRLDCDHDEIEERALALSVQVDGPTLVAFPPFTRSQVVTMALHGTLIPAGITRHIIPGGRALRVNAPLALLSDKYSLEQANQELKTHLSLLQPRRYEEPTILFDS